jgi:hypothetical protein
MAPAAEQPIVITRELLAELLAGVAAQANPGITPDQLTQILSSVSQSNASAMQKSLVRENQDYVEQGPFAFPGKRKLRRKTYFCYAEQRDETLSEAEVDAFNAITRSCTARGGAWTATVLRDGTTEKLHIFVPGKTLDQRMELPSVLDILAELKDGPQAVDRSAMAERIAELEAMVEKLAAAESARTVGQKAATK